MADQYKTIKEYAEGIFKDRGSRFLSFAFPVDNELDVNKHRVELRKKYFDARHHVYAFHIGVDNPFFRSSDDGEPSNSSGPPVLGQIRSFGLTNILIVVVRYFGGTKLGVPGLINAYKTAAFDAISNAQIITKNIEYQIVIEFEYAEMNNVMRLLKNDGIRILSQNFDLNCSIQLMITKPVYEIMLEKLQKIKSVQIIQEIQE